MSIKNTILFYDTETTGLPQWSLSSDDPSQPHLVQLGAILADADTRKEVASIDLIIHPDGWVIGDEVSAIHGITQDMALRVGVSERLALNTFIQLWGSTDTTRVAHNKTFDQRMLRIALKRYESPHMDAWADKDSHLCTMRMYQQLFGGKNVKLIDAYHDATGKELVNAHSAMADARACMEIYWWLLDQQKPKAGSPFDLMERANVSQ